MSLQSIETIPQIQPTAFERLQAIPASVDAAEQACQEHLQEAAELRAEADRIESDGYGGRIKSTLGAVALLNELSADETVPARLVAATYFAVARRTNQQVFSAEQQVLDTINGLRPGRPVFSRPFDTHPDAVGQSRHPDPQVTGLLMVRPQLRFTAFDTQFQHEKAVRMGVGLELQLGDAITSVELDLIRILGLLVGYRAIRRHRDGLSFEQVKGAHGINSYYDNTSELVNVHKRLLQLRQTLRAEGKPSITTGKLEELVVYAQVEHAKEAKAQAIARIKARRATPPNRLAVQYGRASRGR